MDTEKCRLLLQAVEAGSFSAAAEVGHYTPSGVMRAVNALENELGCHVIARSAQGIVVTKDGERLLPILRRFLQCEEEMFQVSAQIRGLVTGNITVGTYFSLAANWLPPVLKAFRCQYPGITVRLEECANHDMYAGLAERRFDCCLTTRRPFHGDWIPLMRDEMLAWLPPDHPLANAASFPVKRFAEESFIQPLPGQDTDVERILTSEGITCQPAYSSVDNYTTYRLVEAGLGVSMNNRLMTASWNGRVVTVPLDPPHFIELGIVLPSVKNAPPAVQRFIRFLQENRETGI